MVCATPGGLAAMLVDAVLDVKPLQPGDMMDPPELFSGLAGEYLKGLTRRQDQLVVVLDVERLLSTQAPLRFQADSSGS
jgi:chemotaxis signal transduction protein